MIICFKIRFDHADKGMMCDPVSQSRNKKIPALGLVDGLFPERSVPVRPAPDLLRPCIEETLPIPLKADVILMIPLAVRDLPVCFDEIIVIDYFFQKIAHANKKRVLTRQKVDEDTMSSLCEAGSFRRESLGFLPFPALPKRHAPNHCCSYC